MKNLLLLLVLLSTVQAVKAQEYAGDKRAQGKYTRCVEEVERQHLGSITTKEYNDMIKECAFEWQVKTDKDDLINIHTIGNLPSLELYKANK